MAGGSGELQMQSAISSAPQSAPQSPVPVGWLLSRAPQVTSSLYLPTSRRITETEKEKLTD